MSKSPQPPQHSQFSRLSAALLLGSVLVAALLFGLDWLRLTQQRGQRLQRAVAVLDVAARAAAQTQGDAAAQSAQLTEITDKHAPVVAQMFIATAGGVDDFGIARGGGLTFGAQKAGPDTAPLLQIAKDSQTAADQALAANKPLDVERMQFELPGDRHALAQPFRAKSGSKEVGGAVIAVLVPEHFARSPAWLWSIALAISVAFLLLGRLPLPTWAAGPASMLAGSLALLLLAPALAASTGDGVAILAADWLIPHTAPQFAATDHGSVWLFGVAVLLSLALGLCTHGFASVLSALRRDPGPYFYVGPALLATGVLIFVPFSVGVGLSFVSKSGEFIGLDNYAEVVRTALDPQSSTHFGRTLAMTVLWTALNIAFHVSIGLGLALVLNRPKLKGRAIYRLLLIVPWAVPSYITALTWKWLFNTQYGPINAMLGLIGVGKIDWLGDSVALNFSANLLTNVWLGFPFMLVISLGALQSIPGELYEAADIDGATSWQKFRHVTLPLLKPALFPAVILGTIWTFNAFNVIYLVSGGGPEHKTDILITEAYYAFAVLRRTGLAAAYSVLIFALLLGYTLLTNRKTRATESVNS